MSIKITNQRRTRLYWGRCVFLMATALFCSACGMNLRSTPASQLTDLNGQWRLLEPQRAALMSQLTNNFEQARNEQMQRQQKARARRTVGVEGDTSFDAVADAAPSAPGGINNWFIRDQREQQQALLNDVLPAELLRIMQNARRVELLPQSIPQRSFDIGGSSLRLTRYAELRVESGWQGNMFVIHSRDKEQGIEIVERYQRVTAEQLTLQLEIGLPDLKRQVFSIRYKLDQ
jgi:hypothetical protein